MLVNYNQLPDTTRVWIYQANPSFPADQREQIKAHLKAFVENWTSHNRNLKTHADLLHDRFVILLVDESQAGASGCSIDKSVHFMKALQAKFNVDLFDRMAFSYKDGETVKTLSRAEFSEAYQDGLINDDTIVFDTLVDNKGKLDQAFEKTLSESWHARMV